MLLHALRHLHRLLDGDLPVEGAGPMVVAGFESPGALERGDLVGAVIGREDFAAVDGELKLHLIQPTGAFGKAHDDVGLVVRPTSSFLGHDGSLTT